QELPFEKIVEELNPARSLSHTPLCQVWFVFRDAPLPTLRTSELSLTPIEIHNKSSQIELILDLCPSPPGLEGCFEYNADLFDQATIERMVGHYQTLLEDLSANPDKRLSELELLSAAERRQLLDDFNAQAGSCAEPGLIAAWFSRRAEASAEAVALQHEEQQVSYEELNRRVNRLGRYLQRIGVGPEMSFG